MESFENFLYIEKNYRELKSEIDALCKKLGRPPVTLVCVTKSGSDEEFLALAHFGATDMGENRPQEAARRKALLLENGYDAIALTDHWFFGHGGEMAGMTILPGVEYNVGGNDGGGAVFHIVGVGMRREPVVSRHNTAQQIGRAHV